MENLLQNIVDQVRADQGGLNAAAEEPPAEDHKMSVPLRNVPAGDPPAGDCEISLPLRHAVAGNSPLGDLSSSDSNQSHKTDNDRSPRPAISRPILTQ